MASIHHPDRHRSALDAFAAAGAPVRLYALRGLGIHGQTVRELLAWGDIRKLGRGLYTLPAPTHDGLSAYADVAARYPDCVITGLSAAWLHGLISDPPAELEISLPRRQRQAGKAKIVMVGAGDEAWPLRTRAIKDERLTSVMTVQASGAAVRVTDLCRTTADILKRPALRRTTGAQVIANYAAAGGDLGALKDACQAMNVTAAAVTTAMVASAGL